MRCAEVIRQLAAPGDDHDPTAVADHLSACPTCAAWAMDATRLEQLWKRTVPADPSSETWDTVWVTIKEGLKAEARSQSQSVIAASNVLDGPIRGRVDEASRARQLAKRRLWISVGIIGIAQAAAILLAVGTVAWQRRQAEPAWQTASLSANASVAVEIEEGRVVLIRSEDQGASVIDVTADEFAYSVDAWYVMFNEVEWMASPKLAMKE